LPGTASPAWSLGSPTAPATPDGGGHQARCGRHHARPSACPLHARARRQRPAADHAPAAHLGEGICQQRPRGRLRNRLLQASSARAHACQHQQPLPRRAARSARWPDLSHPVAPHVAALRGLHVPLLAHVLRVHARTPTQPHNTHKHLALGTASHTHTHAHRHTPTDRHKHTHMDTRCGGPGWQHTHTHTRTCFVEEYFLLFFKDPRTDLTN
jgi:hypothetical protein